MKKYWTCFAAIALGLICYPFARVPRLADAEKTALAARFRFAKLPLAEPPERPPYKTVRKVHPSLERISAWVSSLGAAATLADLDRDGLPNDLILVDPRTDLVTIGPAPGTGDRYKVFALEPSAWAGDSYDLASLAPMGTLAGDFDENGSLDLLVYFWGRTPLVYLRKPVASTTSELSLADFTPVEILSSGERWYSNAAIQADLDGDGHLDLVIGNYYYDGARVLDAKASGTEILHAGKSRALNGGQKHFLLFQPAENGSTTPRYKDVGGVVTEEVARGWTLALGAADIDGDLLPELYIANDFGPDRLLHNRSTPGTLRFAPLEGERDLTTPKSCVLGHDSFKGMGVDFGDINGDGLLDIYVSNIATKFGLTESHFVWLNTGQAEKMERGIAPFVHGSEKLGLSRSGFAWEARLADFNNDGVLEAMQACGFIRGKVNRWPELQALGTSNDQIVQNPRFWPSFKPGADLSGGDCNPFFVRGSNDRYYDITPQLGLAQPMVSRGIAIADVDADGRLDFVTANQWGPSFFFKNESPHAGSFLGLRLLHANGSPAIGAVVRVNLPKGPALVSRVDGGSGHSGRRSADVHFGLANWDQTTPVPVEITWRDFDGKIRNATLKRNPGWHSVQLSGEAVATALHRPAGLPRGSPLAASTSRQ